MKIEKVLLIAMIAGILSSCGDKDNEKTNSEIVGKWRLVEMLGDPGDGSGTFQPVTSDKTIDFHADGTFTSNGLICHLSIDNGQSSSGTYSLANSTLISSDCADPSGLKFEQTGSTLVINYLCIEACKAKFARVP